MRIKKSWRCTREQVATVLGTPESTLDLYAKYLEKTHLTKDQQTRLSYALNIHQAIKTTFNNPANIDNFRALKNNNGIFKGRAPIDLLFKGSMEDIRNTYRHIAALRE